MKVAFTDEARTDLLLIGDYIAADNPWRALTFVEELEMRCKAIGEFPRSNPLLPHHEQSNIRRAVYGNYGIFYMVGTEAIEILRVLNSSMDYEWILFGDS